MYTRPTHKLKLQNTNSHKTPGRQIKSNSVLTHLSLYWKQCRYLFDVPAGITFKVTTY